MNILKYGGVGGLFWSKGSCFGLRIWLLFDFLNCEVLFLFFYVILLGELRMFWIVSLFLKCWFGLILCILLLILKRRKKIGLILLEGLLFSIFCLLRIGRLLIMIVSNEIEDGKFNFGENMGFLMVEWNFCGVFFFFLYMKMKLCFLLWRFVILWNLDFLMGIICCVWWIVKCLCCVIYVFEVLNGF